jgi:DNA-binding CsgD family transcriptional regulator
VRVAGEAAETGRLLRVPAGLAWALSVGALTWSIVDTRHAVKVGEEALAAALEVDDNMIRDAEAAVRAGARIEAGRSGITAGHALTAAGERERAVAQLRAACAEMSRCGARHLEQEATYQLRRLGASAPAAVPRRRGDAGTAELSKREREIAALVAAGNSNPQIGRALFLSPKTIEGHMRRIFDKLGVSSRAEVAATIAREEGPARPVV